MRGISSYDSSSISTLFSSLGSSSGSNFLGINLQDYATIKSGTYGKLMKSYYSKVNADSTKTSSKDKTTSTSTSKDSTKTIANMEEAAQELTTSAKELYSTKTDSVFAKKNGNYDTKKISEKVGSFVEDYNNLLTTSAKSTSSRIENSVDSLKLLTTGKSISVDSKTGILSFDSGKFSSADMDKVKKLFNGTGSYAYGVATRSSLIDSYAQSEAEKANTYGKNGKYSYNYNSGNIFYDSF